MKLNNFQKNFYISFLVIISILVVTLLWENITLPIDNTSEISKGYNPTNDTIRYIVFISLPLMVYLFSFYKFSGRNLKIKELIFEEHKQIENFNQIILILSFIFIFFIFFEFFSINFIFSQYVLDHSHDGNYLTPAQNYLSSKNYWTSSFLTHGASDIFYPLLMWKIFGFKTIGAARIFPIFLILLLKLLCVLLSYQFTKITNLNKNTKIIFFTIFTSILLSMSHYTFLGAGYYLSHKDIYVILFLIFFTELFIKSKIRNFSIVGICIVVTSSILLQIDRGSFIYSSLIFYFCYLVITKKYKDVFLVFISLIVCWGVAINLIGFDEFKAYLENTKVMAISGEMIHGLKYPTPFFSMVDDPNGARATRALILQLIAGLFILGYLVSDRIKISNSQKIFFLFLFLLSLMTFKNALGRSDGAHIRGSHDFPILIISFFIINYLLIFFEKKFFFKKFISNKILFAISVIFLTFYYTSNKNNYSVENVKNYKNNILNFIKLKDEMFLDDKTIELTKFYNKISKKQNCVENITYDDAIPYLLKKPSCTKYWASWIASPIKIQKDYINELKKTNPEYILYYSRNNKFDGLEIYERIKLVNNYVLSNYYKFDEINGYIFLKKNK